MSHPSTRFGVALERAAISPAATGLFVVQYQHIEIARCLIFFCSH